MAADVELTKLGVGKKEDDDVTDPTYLDARAKHIYGQMYRLPT